MTGRIQTFLWALPVLGAFVFLGCPPANGPGDAGGTVSAKGPVADNQRCHVCHIYYEDEELAVQHARANVGCERCHGRSDAHCSDENNLTPPQIMYPAARINPACMTCHLAADLAKQKDHKPLLAAAPADQKRCTECHGKHRMPRREIRWDKTTGKLLPEEKTP